MLPRNSNVCLPQIIISMWVFPCNCLKLILTQIHKLTAIYSVILSHTAKSRLESYFKYWPKSGFQRRLKRSLTIFPLSDCVMRSSELKQFGCLGILLIFSERLFQDILSSLLSKNCLTPQLYYTCVQRHLLLFLFNVTAGNFYWCSLVLILKDKLNSQPLCHSRFCRSASHTLFSSQVIS